MTAVLALCVLSVSAGWAERHLANSGTAGDKAPPKILPGAVEVGFGGALTTVEGIQTGTLLARTGLFRGLAGGLIGFEVGAGYTHESSLDVFDLEGVFSWGRRWENTGTYPFVSAGGGWRHEEVGSFGQSRYPVGVGLGVRSLLGQRAGFRAEYRFRRVLGDPVSDFSEHQLTLGISVFFRNTHDTIRRDS